MVLLTKSRSFPFRGLITVKWPSRPRSDLRLSAQERTSHSRCNAQTRTLHIHTYWNVPLYQHSSAMLLDQLECLSLQDHYCDILTALGRTDPDASPEDRELTICGVSHGEDAIFDCAIAQVIDEAIISSKPPPNINFLADQLSRTGEWPRMRRCPKGKQRRLKTNYAYTWLGMFVLAPFVCNMHYLQPQDNES